ncbi:MAG: putative membrane protein [Clostridium sp.]|jgi:uncharacterized membrane protein
MNTLKRLIKNIYELSFIVTTMGIIYLLIEFIYKGSTYWQMAVIGGIAGMLVGLINKIFPWNTPLWTQGSIGMIVATICEFIGGCYLNLYMHYSMWSYIGLPFNLLGQVCLYFSITWFFVSLLGIFIDDFIRWKLFKEAKPRYKIF